jgi:ribosomal protein S18 acetylase RimI-like enzyme
VTQSSPQIRTFGRADITPVVTALAAAFDGYPLTEWTVLRDRRHARRARLYFRSLVDKALAQGFAGCSDDGCAAALWVPPGRHRMSWPLQLRLFSRMPHICGPRRFPSRLRAFRHLAAHHPDEPHYTLDVLGTHPSARGRGLGSALLGDGLARADADRVGTYLLTSSKAAIPFYERRDFAVKEELRLSGGASPSGDLTMWAMWRPAAT